MAAASQTPLVARPPPYHVPSVWNATVDTLTATEVARLRAARVRVAACLTGAPRGLLDPRLQEHFRQFVSPLRQSMSENHTFLSIFAHLHAPVNESVRTMSQLKDALQASTLRLYTDSSAEHLWLRHMPGFTSQGDACRTLLRMAGNGYPSMVKNRGCANDIHNAEARVGARYDFVLRLRPDVEYAMALPPAPEWSRLRRDLVLVPTAVPWRAGDAKRARPVPSPKARLGQTVLRCGPDHTGELFVDDNGILFARDHPFGRSFFGLATTYEHCTSEYVRQRQLVCGPSVPMSPECAIIHGLRAGSGPAGAFVGEMPWTRHSAWLECMPPVVDADKRGARCPQPCNGCPAGSVLRRRVRFVARADDLPHWPMLTRAIEPSHFSAAHLVPATEEHAVPRKERDFSEVSSHRRA